MSSWKKWAVRILGGLVALIVVALSAIYVLSERVMSRTYTFREVPITRLTDSASLARGAHLVELSCRGCHTQTLQGQVFFDQPGVARLVAPNVPERLATYTDAEFAGFLRYGVRKDGSSLVVMPPPSLHHLSDGDLAAIISYLRTVPTPKPIDLPKNSYGPLARVGLVTGQYGEAVTYIDTTVARIGADSAYLTTRRGEYLARVICAECHGAKLMGDPANGTPALILAVGYDLTQLTTLLRTATPRDPATKLTIMAEVARTTLHHLHDDEIAAIHAYLTSLPITGVAGVK